MPETQLYLSLTNEIGELYAGFTRSALSMCQAAIAIGEKLGEADHCPGFDFAALPFAEDKQKIFRNIYARRDELTEQMILDLIALPEVRERPALISGPAIRWAEWTKPLGTLLGWVRKSEAEVPVDQWPKIHRDALRDRLKPIVELYKRL